MSTKTAQASAAGWHFAATLADLKKNSPMMVRAGGRQIALFDSPKGILACDNRCPHEGCPLCEGDLSAECTLTCNWHNWKFNLETGENLLGGDKLRVYPVHLQGDEIRIDLTDPPPEERYSNIIANLKDSFADHSYNRIGREIARLIRLGADPLDSLRCAIGWSWRKMEFGCTHAFAGMADWLVLYREADDEELKMVCLMESVGHAAFDVLRETDYPFTSKSMKYSESKFLQAVEDEDEDTAVALIRGGLDEKMSFGDFEQALTRAALAHYLDFGHSLIYITKIGYLVKRLGDSVLEPLLLSLVREIIYAVREDKIPEFRHYRTGLENWGRGKSIAPDPESLSGRGIGSAVNAVVDAGHLPENEIYQCLLHASALSFLKYDVEQQYKTHVSVSANVGWLSFTHEITFANAVRIQCTKYPGLWPRGLLQMACFIGRNAAFTTKNHELEKWMFDDVSSGVEGLIHTLFDHGRDEYIVSVHLLKTALAVRQEIEHAPPVPSSILAAALNRFFNSPLKRKHARRTAYQSLRFAAKESGL